MIIIDIKKDCRGSLDAALKKYKNKFNSMGIVDELRDRKSFTKKSIKKRKQKLKAVYIQTKFKDDE